MTPEEWERINERFERIESNLERISEAHVELEAAQRNTQRAVDRRSEEHEQWSADFEHKLKALMEHEQVLDRAMFTLTTKVDALADVQKETDGKLNALIDTVDRYIRGRNGKE